MARLLALFVALVLSVTAARADSCWVHNGSLMRLQDAGTLRLFSYEVPRVGLRSAGVWRGTVLFDGENLGGWYRGFARVFSSSCPGEPLDYYVEGPVTGGQTRVILQGAREVYDDCRPTGRYTTDLLVFDYSHRC